MSGTLPKGRRTKAIISLFFLKMSKNGENQDTFLIARMNMERSIVC